MTKLEYLNKRIDFFKQAIEEDKEIMPQEYINEIKEKLALSEQMRDDFEVLEIIKNRVPKRLILEFVSLEEEDIVAKVLEVEDE